MLVAFCVRELWSSGVRDHVLSEADWVQALVSSYSVVVGLAAIRASMQDS